MNILAKYITLSRGNQVLEAEKENLKDANGNMLKIEFKKDDKIVKQVTELIKKLVSE